MDHLGVHRLVAPRGRRAAGGPARHDPLGVYDVLASLGAEPTEQRVVEAGDVVTAAGVSAGIDLALTLVARLAGDDAARAIQLGIEYDPQPPFDAGAPSKAPADVRELVGAILDEQRRDALAADDPTAPATPEQWRQ